MIRTLIIDDETLARQRISRLLQAYQHSIKVVGECKSGSEAIKAIKECKPDLIFLDIQMRDMNGFDVLNKLPSDHLPVIIFVTAYNQYALRAFEYFAQDYILKPINEERFEQSLERVIKLLRSGKNNLSASTLNSLIQLLDKKEEAEEQKANLLSIKQAGKIHFLEKDTIKYITASGYYVEVFTIDRKYLLRESLTALLQRLDVPSFIRVHRSTVINTNYLKEIGSIGFGDVEVIMKDEQVFRVSKSYKRSLYNNMGL